MQEDKWFKTYEPVKPIERTDQVKIRGDGLEDKVAFIPSEESINVPLIEFFIK